MTPNEKEILIEKILSRCNIYQTGTNIREDIEKIPTPQLIEVWDKLDKILSIDNGITICKFNVKDDNSGNQINITFEFSLPSTKVQTYGH